MSIYIEKSSEEPILFHVIQGHIDTGEIRQAYEQDAALCKNDPGPIFRISDSRSWEPDFSQMMLVVAEMAREMQVRNAFESKVVNISVTNDDVVRLGMDSMSQQQYGGNEIITFTDMDAALAYVRDQLAF
ncbi:MAG TPA: hypothetical protein PKD09_25315 [Aggregatilinea sp.]|uniref:hypothetical protein n=1 Tax=Aggregatilinea sp. TaxID=2806333 RepID=UPI002CDB1489|nr:hypothetical protein [Aggregatilinea sp.]HML24999.1 hypothetical protein [Aggregatilinea sp.]